MYISLGAELLGVALIIVYVGAIAILFLFIVMMLNLRITESYSQITVYTPINLVFMVFISEVMMGIKLYHDVKYQSDNLFKIDGAIGDNILTDYTNWAAYILGKTNIHYIGESLYNHYFFLVIMAALLLLTAMVGSISLTLAEKGEYLIGINNFSNLRAVSSYYSQKKDYNFLISSSNYCDNNVKSQTY